MTCERDFKRGLEHAVAAGKLLIEAKPQLTHWRSLPWLREHVQINGRTAQRYMEIAPFALVGDAVPAIAAPRPPKTWQEISAWAHRRLDEPFCDLDFHNGCFSDWIYSKLCISFGVPAIASFCMEVEGVELNTLRLCLYDERFQAVAAIVPYAGRCSDQELPSNFGGSAKSKLQILVA